MQKVKNAFNLLWKRKYILPNRSIMVEHVSYHENNILLKLYLYIIDNSSFPAGSCNQNCRLSLSVDVYRVFTDRVILDWYIRLGF